MFDSVDHSNTPSVDLSEAVLTHLLVLEPLTLLYLNLTVDQGVKGFIKLRYDSQIWNPSVV